MLRLFLVFSFLLVSPFIILFLFPFLFPFLVASFQFSVSSFPLTLCLALFCHLPFSLLSVLSPFGLPLLDDLSIVNFHFPRLFFVCFVFRFYLLLFHCCYLISFYRNNPLIIYILFLQNTFLSYFVFSALCPLSSFVSFVHIPLVGSPVHVSFSSFFSSSLLLRRVLSSHTCLPHRSPPPLQLRIVSPAITTTILCPFFFPYLFSVLLSVMSLATFLFSHLSLSLPHLFFFLSVSLRIVFLTFAESRSFFSFYLFALVLSLVSLFFSPFF